MANGLRVRVHRPFQLGLAVALGVGSCGIAAAACVNTTGTGGCYKTIGAAVAAASANDTILVAPGTYQEDVVITKPLSLVGAGAKRTIIDATGLANGIHVDGYENPGLSHVNVNGFTVENANFQGILVTNASSVNLSSNRVTGNDTHLQPTTEPPTCPGIEGVLGGVFVAGEGFDCGEGIHLSGVTHSIVADNVVQGNAGGILLSDDTGGTHDNVLSGNTVQNNLYDCGITLASHHFDSEQLDPAFGVYHNTVTGNTSSGNGTATAGEGAGVGLFAAGPGAQTYGNVVIKNVLTGNGLPGVTMHSHAFNQDLNDNLIVGNQISGNGPDGDSASGAPTGIVVFSDDSGGAAPITGTLISKNVFKQEGIDVAVKTPGSVDTHFNNFLDSVGVSNLGTGSVDATENWWKCRGGPGAQGCATVAGSDVLTAPWLIWPSVPLL